MQNPFLFAAALVATALAPQLSHAQCKKSFDPAKHNVKRVVPQPGFDTAAFYSEVTRALGNDKMGYAFMLRNADGKVVVRSEYGYARSPCAPEKEQKFTRNTKTFWGSGGSKLSTFVSVLHRIENAPSKPKPVAAYAVPYVDYLPKKSRSRLHPEYRPVTIEMLGQHRAGFQKSAPWVDGAKVPIFQRLANEPESPVGKRRYSNTSASMFQVLPYFWDPKKAQKAEDSIPGGDMDYESYWWVKGYEIYEAYVQKNIFKPHGINARCQKLDYDGKNWARYYASDSAAAGDGYKPPFDMRCSMGGWVMSMNDMSDFVYLFTQTEKIISEDSYKKMTTGDKTRFGFYGRKKVTGGHVLKHNGANGWGSRSMIAAFPNGYTFVGITNTKVGTDFNVAGAYQRAVKPCVPKPGPRGARQCR